MKFVLATSTMVVRVTFDKDVYKKDITFGALARFASTTITTIALLECVVRKPDVMEWADERRIWILNQSISASVAM
jgi:hypothetical protein